MNWTCPTCMTVWSAEPETHSCIGPECSGGTDGKPAAFCEDCRPDRAVKCYSCDRLLCEGCRIETGYFLPAVKPSSRSDGAQPHGRLQIKEYACLPCWNTCCVCSQPKPDCLDVPGEGRVCRACRSGHRDEIAEMLSHNVEAYQLEQQRILEWVGIE